MSHTPQIITRHHTLINMDKTQWNHELQGHPSKNGTVTRVAKLQQKHHRHDGDHRHRHWQSPHHRSPSNLTHRHTTNQYGRKNSCEIIKGRCGFESFSNSNKIASTFRYLECTYMYLHVLTIRPLQVTTKSTPRNSSTYAIPLISEVVSVAQSEHRQSGTTDNRGAMAHIA